MSQRPRTLADVYRDKPLTAQQCRRIIALLGLATPRRTRTGNGDGDEKAA
ncbi:hypothetical protein [Streptomyces sp. NPDC051001]